MRETDPKTPFAAALRSLRKARGLTQEQLATSGRIPQATLSNWERGDNEPDQDGRIRLLDALGATAEERAAIGALLTGAVVDAGKAA